MTPSLAMSIALGATGPGALGYKPMIDQLVTPPVQSNAHGPKSKNSVAADKRAAMKRRAVRRQRKRDRGRRCARQTNARG